MNDIMALQAAILKMHGARADHLESVPVKEMFRSKLVWEGTVEVFRLVDFPPANLCYAWCHDQECNQTRFVAVLGVPPIKTAEDAVRVVVARDFKQLRSN